MAFGIFAGVTFVGFLLSFGIRSDSLEADGWESSDEDEEEEAGDDGEDADERTLLMSR